MESNRSIQIDCMEPSTSSYLIDVQLVQINVRIKFPVAIFLFVAVVSLTSLSIFSSPTHALVAQVKELRSNFELQSCCTLMEKTFAGRSFHRQRLPTNLLGFQGIHVSEHEKKCLSQEIIFKDTLKIHFSRELADDQF